eukprot:gene6614-biopygen13761
MPGVPISCHTSDAQGLGDDEAGSEVKSLGVEGRVSADELSSVGGREDSSGKGAAGSVEGSSEVGSASAEGDGTGCGDVAIELDLSSRDGERGDVDGVEGGQSATSVEGSGSIDSTDEGCLKKKGGSDASREGMENKRCKDPHSAA